MNLENVDKVETLIDTHKNLKTAIHNLEIRKETIINNSKLDNYPRAYMFSCHDGKIATPVNLDEKSSVEVIDIMLSQLHTKLEKIESKILEL